MKILWGAVVSSGFLIMAVASPTHAAEDVWRELDPENTLYIEMDAGRVIVELSTDIAPQNVAQIKTLVREGRYKDIRFYRVIENFVAQAGLQADAGDVSTVAAELVLPIEKLNGYGMIETDDAYAPETGFYKGFAMGHDPESGDAWALHCPGVMAMARGNDKDSAKAEFYFPIGQAPRHLDRNMTVIGRVIGGFEHIQGVARGNRDFGGGVIAVKDQQTPILKMQIAADLPLEERTPLDIINTNHPRFLERVEAMRSRSGPFWHHTPSSTLDICTVPVLYRSAG